MNIVQKKAYIEKLKVKAQSTNNSTYTKFLNECVQKYKAELCGNLPKPVPQETLVINNQKKSKFKYIAICLSIVFILCICGFLGYTTYVKFQITGNWGKDDTLLYQDIKFKNDGTYSYYSYSIIDYMDGTTGIHLSGKYVVIGNIIICIRDKNSDMKDVFHYKNGLLFLGEYSYERKND